MEQDEQILAEKNHRAWQRVWRVFLSFVVVFLMWIVWCVGTGLYGQHLVRENESMLRICLSADKSIDDSDIHLTGETLATLHTFNDDYRSSIMYSALSEDERLIYRAMEYAMQEGLPYVCVDSKLTSDTDTLIKVLRYLALDSPLMEQNLRYGTSEFSVSYAVDVPLAKDHYANLSGYYIRVNNFNADNWTKKMAALEKAVELVEALPEGASAEDKADVLFRQIAQGAKYFEYPDEEEQQVYSYLYDALITGQTNCDGYANALALVYRLAGIECVEKTSEEHTWVCFSLDGKWYNADATGDGLIPEKSTEWRGGFYYAFADMLQTYTPLHADIYPSCSESLYLSVDAYIDTTADGALRDAVISGLRAHDEKWALVVVKLFKRSQAKAQLQTVANTLQIRFYPHYIQLADGRYAVFVYKEL